MNGTACCLGYPSDSSRVGRQLVSGKRSAGRSSRSLSLANPPTRADATSVTAPGPPVELRLPLRMGMPLWPPVAAGHAALAADGILGLRRRRPALWRGEVVVLRAHVGCVAGRLGRAGALGNALRSGSRPSRASKAAPAAWR
jgi:hypothetical protein